MDACRIVVVRIGDRSQEGRRRAADLLGQLLQIDAKDAFRRLERLPFLAQSNVRTRDALLFIKALRSAGIVAQIEHDPDAKGTASPLPPRAQPADRMPRAVLPRPEPPSRARVEPRTQSEPVLPTEDTRPYYALEASKLLEMCELEDPLTAPIMTPGFDLAKHTSAPIPPAPAPEDPRVPHRMEASELDLPDLDPALTSPQGLDAFNFDDLDPIPVMAPGKAAPSPASASPVGLPRSPAAPLPEFDDLAFDQLTDFDPFKP